MNSDDLFGKIAFAKYKTRKLWNDYKGKIAVTAMATTALAVVSVVNHRNTRDEFLAMHGLKDEFHIWFNDDDIPSIENL